jgi:hypothetical protein
MREQEPRVVLTIGHSTRTWEAFPKLLRRTSSMDREDWLCAFGKARELASSTT